MSATTSSTMPLAASMERKRSTGAKARFASLRIFRGLGSTSGRLGAAVPCGEVERALHGGGKIDGPSLPPVVEEQKPRRLACHVRMNGDDVDSAPAKRFEHG